MADDVEARALRRIKEIFGHPQESTQSTVALADVSGASKVGAEEVDIHTYIYIYRS